MHYAYYKTIYSPSVEVSRAGGFMVDEAPTFSLGPSFSCRAASR